MRLQLSQVMVMVETILHGVTDKGGRLLAEIVDAVLEQLRIPKEQILRLLPDNLLAKAVVADFWKSESWGEIVRRYLFGPGSEPPLDRSVVNVLRRRTKDPHLREEALSRLGHDLPVKLKRYDPTRPLKPWLKRVADRVLLELLRPRDAERRRLAPLPVDEVAARHIEDQEDQPPQLEDVYAALEKLDEKDRDLILQRVDKKPAELAKERGATARQISRRLERIRRAIRRSLQEKRQ